MLTPDMLVKWNCVLYTTSLDQIFLDQENNQDHDELHKLVSRYEILKKCHKSVKDQVL